MNKYLLKCKLLKTRNDIVRFINKKRFNDELVILSSNKYLYSVKEDIMTEYYLLKKGINTKILPYEIKDNSCKNYLIKSTWGYQCDVDNFIEYINLLGDKLINYDFIVKNINKYSQFEMLKNSGVDCIDTYLVNNSEDIMLHLNGEMVIKPIISASSFNTFKINDINKEEVISKIKDDLGKGYLLQKFIPEIKDGEKSVILFNGEIAHVINRFPGVFTGTPKLEEIKDIDEGLNKLVNQFKSINEYKDCSYMRLDCVFVDNKYIVMEIEVIEPQFFFETISDKDSSYNKYIDMILSKIKK